MREHSARGTRLTRRPHHRPRLLVWVLSVVWLVTLILAVAGPVVAHLLGTPDPAAPVTRPFDPASTAHRLGTDALGRDVLARMLLGNVGLVLPPACAALLSTACGVLFAMVSATVSALRPVIGWVTTVLLVIPAMVVLLAVITSTGGRFAGVAAVAMLLSVPLSTRYLVAAVRPALASEYVDVARVSGRHTVDIIVRDILPTIRRPILADLGVRYVSIVFLTATAAFLAGASNSGEVTWAGMVGSALPGITLNPWAVASPVIAIIALTAPPALIMDHMTGGRR